MAYTKLDSGITESTIWQAPDATLRVWIAMLARADQHGYVGASVPGLASLARVTLDACVTALDTLRAPDEWSRTKDHEGRRIADADGGWVLLNHAKYRGALDADMRRERSRVAMQRLRQERAEDARQQLSDVSNVDRRSPQLAQGEAEEEEEVLKHIEATPLVQKPVGFSPPPCPTQEIVDAYRKHLPAMPQPNVLNAARKTAISARWREVCASEKFGRDQGLEWFNWFFSDVARSKFLTGRTASNSQRPFRATLDWLMKPTNFAKTVDGNYRETA